MINLIDFLAVALLGIGTGAIINWLADDLPFSNVIKRPHYPDGLPRPPRAWVGLIAFLTGGRVSPSGAKLSLRHPFTEVIIATLFAYTVFQNGFTPQSLYLMGCVAFLGLITVMDLEHRMILVLVIVAASIFALVGAAAAHPWERVTFQDHLLGGLLGFAVFGILYLGGFIFSAVMANMRGEALEEVALGYGDVLLAMLSGFILGWQALIFAVTIAVFLGGAGALVFMAMRLVIRGRYEWFTALPYGQYIVLGTLIMMLWRAPVIAFLQRGG